MRQDTLLNIPSVTPPEGRLPRRVVFSELPHVRDGVLRFTTKAVDKRAPVPVGSTDWYHLLEEIASFVFEDQFGRAFTARRERREQQWYWYAYRKHGTKLRKVYLGKPQHLELARLQAAARDLADLPPQALPQPSPTPHMRPPDRPHRAEQLNGVFQRSTKLRIPPLPDNLLQRPRLTHLLTRPLQDAPAAMHPNQPCGQPLLTVITAPAGYGKSTLLSDWLHQAGDRNIGWLSLDPEDNALLPFWRSIIAALQTGAPELGRQALLLLQEARSPGIDAVVAALLADIQHTPRPVVLVLDDFHLIDTPAIHDSLAAVLTHCPPHLHVVISSRTRPPLPFGRLRLQATVTELHAADLRLTDEEGRAVLSRDPRLARNPEAMTLVLRKTEGWVAGVSLFALALQQHTDLETGLAAFDGNHPYLVEYFDESVWRQQSPTIRTFLLSTAILEEMTGALCTAVTGLPNGQQLLTQIAQANLFLSPLDGRPGWYRYHPLFAQALQGMLVQTHPADAPALHRKAAEWYLAQEELGDALGHLVAGQAWSAAAQTLEQYALPLLRQGEVARLLGCLRQLPREAVQARPTLLVLMARALMLTGELNALEAWLEQLEASSVSETILQEVAAIRAIVSASGAGGSAPERERTGWESLDAFTRSIHAWSQDDTEASYAAAARAVQAGQATGLRSASLLAAGTMASLHLIRGELGAALRVAHDGLALDHTTAAAILAESHQPNPATGPLLLALGVIHYERNRLELAQECLEKALELSLRLGREDYLFAVHLALARTLGARGLRQAADALLQAGADRARAGRGVFWPDADILAYQAWNWLQHGELALAVQWAQTAGVRLDDPQVAQRKLEYWVYGEILLAQGRYEQAASILSQLAQSATHIGTRTEPLVKLLVAYASALFAQGQRSAALPVLERALSLGQPEGYIRPFLDSASWHTRALLAYYQQKTRAGAHIEAYVEQLLAERALAPLSTTRSADGTRPAISLRRREREILRLVDGGLSNPEIAHKLVIEATTVKSHLQHIYQRLGVSTRHQAVLHAKTLQLL